MKKSNRSNLGIGLIMGFLVQTINPCLNTIKNNTEHTYKIAEIKQDNLFLKHTIDLPADYLDDEQKAHTLTPGESVSFGGHYLPTFAVFKKYGDNWENIIVVKQRECGPRGKEEKTLLLTDVLKGDLPGDFQQSYKFSFKKQPETIAAPSMNKEILASNKNKYQLVSDIFAKFEQQIQEIVSQQLREEKEIEKVCPAATSVINGKETEKTTPETTPANKDAMDVDAASKGQKTPMDVDASTQQHSAASIPATTADKTTVNPSAPQAPVSQNPINTPQLPANTSLVPVNGAQPSTTPATTTVIDEMDIDDDGKICPSCLVP